MTHVITVRQNQFDKLCNSERGWAFERVINGALDGYDHKTKDGVESRNECARLCLLETDFECRSAEYDFEGKMCILSREDRRTQPEAFRNGIVGVDYIENQCAKREWFHICRKHFAFLLLQKLHLQRYQTAATPLPSRT